MDSNGIKFSSLLHSSISHETLRNWNSVPSITSACLMYPVFIVENDFAEEEISSMPGIYRYGQKALVTHLRPLVEKGLKSVLLFGVITTLKKDDKGSSADSNENPVVRAIPVLRAEFPDLLITCDVCLCPYTSHGHCGLLKGGIIDNTPSIERIKEIAVAYAKAGCHVVAPSDMMDGRIGAIRRGLIAAGLNNVSILSYAAKFCSAFYGPFRGACNSSPASGDRKAYQLPPGSAGLANRAVVRDVEEGANILMVKPGMPYLDIVRQTKQDFPHYPLCAYQVSGEYAMLYYASKAGSIDLKSGVTESLIAFRRAGADFVISYFTPIVLDWLEEGSL